MDARTWRSGPAAAGRLSHGLLLESQSSFLGALSSYKNPRFAA